MRARDSKHRYKHRYGQDRIIDLALACDVQLDKVGVCKGMSMLCGADFLAGPDGFGEFVRIINYVGDRLYNEEEKLDAEAFQQLIDSARQKYREQYEKLLPIIEEMVDLQISIDIEEKPQNSVPQERKLEIENIIKKTAGKKAFAELQYNLDILYKQHKSLSAEQRDYFIAVQKKILCAHLVAGSRKLLDPDTRTILQLPAFFESIQIAQSLHNLRYNHLLDPSKDTIGKILDLITPQKAEQAGGIGTIENMMRIFTPETLENFLASMAKCFEECEEGMSILLDHPHHHAIMLCYKPDGWYLLDPNQLPGARLPLKCCGELANYIFGAFHKEDADPGQKNIFLSIQGLNKNRQKLEDACETFHQTAAAQAVEMMTMERAHLTRGEISQNLLQEAIYHGDQALTEKLLSEDTNPSLKKMIRHMNSLEESAFHLAADVNNSFAITRLCECIPPDELKNYFDGTNYKNYTPLQIAVIYNNAEAASALLEAGSDPNKHNLLKTAAKFNSPACIKLLLDHGAIPDEFDHPLDAAIWSGNIDCIKILLHAGVTSRNPLNAIRSTNNIEIIRLLAQMDEYQGLSIEGETLREIAENESPGALVHALVKLRYPVNSELLYEQTALAIKQSNFEYADVFLQYMGMNYEPVRRVLKSMKSDYTEIIVNQTLERLALAREQDLEQHRKPDKKHPAEFFNRKPVNDSVAHAVKHQDTTKKSW